VRRLLHPFVLVVTAILLGGYTYIALRLTATAPARLALAAPFVMVWILPVVFWGGDRDRRSRCEWVQTLSFLCMGWVSFVFVLTVARDGRRPRPAALPPLAARPRVAAIVPALDEEEALPRLLAEIPRGCVADVVVVDGGSRDRTAAAARRYGARVVAEPRRGYGRACAAGAAAADADVLVFLDGDGSDDPSFLQAVLEPVLAGRAALSLGARRSGEPGALLPHQRLGNAVVTALVRLLYGVRLHDVPPLRAVRRDVLERLDLREMTYGWPTEMIVKAARAGLPVAEVPVHARLRRGGASKIAGRAVPSARAGARMLAVVARHA